MAAEINISVSNQSRKTPEELIEEWGKSGVELEGKGFLNPVNGLMGFYVSEKGNATNIIDIFLKPAEQLEESNA